MITTYLILSISKPVNRHFDDRRNLIMTNEALALLKVVDNVYLDFSCLEMTARLCRRLK